MGFKTEKQLFDTAIASAPIQHLAQLYYRTAFLIEPQGLFGVPDLVIASFNPSRNTEDSIMVFAFEMKLSNWQRALVQAFRYRSFAEASYVLLDKKHIAPAIRQVDRFERANIGLLSIDLLGNVAIHHQPKYDLPFCERMRANLEKIVYETSTKDREPKESILPYHSFCTSMIKSMGTQWQSLLLHKAPSFSDYHIKCKTPSLLLAQV